MKVLGFRLCTVSPEASNLAAFFDAIGFERHPLEGGSSAVSGTFTGAVFAAGESWLAMWPPGEMPTGMMLQVVVDDADAFAAHARQQGLDPAGPTDAQGKRIYFLQAPTGLQISIQSRLVPQTKSLPAPPPLPVWAKDRPVPLARMGASNASPARAGSSTTPPARPGSFAPPARAGSSTTPPARPGAAPPPSPARTAAQPAPLARSAAPARTPGASVPPPPVRTNVVPPPTRPGAFRRVPR